MQAPDRKWILLESYIILTVFARIMIASQYLVFWLLLNVFIVQIAVIDVQLKEIPPELSMVTKYGCNECVTLF